ncbi:IclR family transcriptional regulator [Enemella dayhoffiae]|uniref:Glycerol operon regulatory protein n=1 Tax=Enemella dayhoffiae TaxID=2016507 RepID=A0A255GN37_9ACTN|nr:IclR family transcriptional regulator [Enemella dayhoffiae]OYO17240.1 IclR family transcriptional regulator [Enemella dayhoffiae]
MDRQEDGWHTTTPKPATDGEGLRSVAAALDLLECFAVDGELGVSDLARRMGVAKSTAHRLLSTLRSRGFVEQSSQTGRYRLGLHLFELGHLAQVRSTLRQVALPVCQELVRRTGLTVNLSVPDGSDVVFVERIEAGPTGVGLNESGRRLPAHVSSSGKALAAWNDPLARARVEAGFPPRARNTVRSAADWEQALLEVRQRGFAISRDESYDGVTTMAVPVLDVGRESVAAVSFFGRTEDVERRQALLLQLLQHAATRISNELSTARRQPI